MASIYVSYINYLPADIETIQIKITLYTKTIFYNQNSRWENLFRI